MMTSTDPIADMLTRIRNGVIAGKSEVQAPHSNAKEAVARILSAQKFIESVSVSGDGTKKVLNIVINQPTSNPVINHVSRLSKPGQRVYAKAKQIPKVKHGRGFVVVSTSRGLMSGDEAKAAGLGGELVCEVY